MATSSPRDVKLKVGVEADASQLDNLTEGFKDLTSAGKAVTPEMAKIAAELEAAGAATKGFCDAEATLAAQVKASKQGLAEQAEALQRLSLTTSQAEKATDEYKTSVTAAKLAILDSPAALRAQQEALDKAATSTPIADLARLAFAFQSARLSRVGNSRAGPPRSTLQHVCGYVGPVPFASRGGKHSTPLNSTPRSFIASSRTVSSTGSM
jgi:septal ring factor EnvC (AmiA/AmiB activator)